MKFQKKSFLLLGEDILSAAIDYQIIKFLYIYSNFIY